MFFRIPRPPRSEDPACWHGFAFEAARKTRYDFPLNVTLPERCMAEPFKASLITPEAIVLDTPITAAQIPAFDGLVGILNHRAPLLAKLGTGILRLDTANGSHRFMVSGGYAQMKGEELTILTPEAIPVAQVTPQMIAAEQAKLSSVQGIDLPAMEQRQALQRRIAAMHQAQEQA
jgi:F-type H+-transporting ATPase subunit epsilon